MQKRFPNKIQYIQTDVTSEESVTKAIDTIVEKVGQLDGMIANAGVTRHLPAFEFSMVQVEQLFRLNIFGACNCAVADAKMFVKLKTKRSIVFTASMISYRPNRVSQHSPMS